MIQTAQYLAGHRFFDTYVTWATSPGFKRNETDTVRRESMVTASTCARAAPTTRRLTAFTASTLFRTATWYRLVPVWSLTSTIQPKACPLMNVAWHCSRRPSTLTTPAKEALFAMVANLEPSLS